MADEGAGKGQTFEQRQELMRFTFSYLVLGGSFIVGGFVVLGVLYLLVTIERERFFNYIFSQPAAVLGVPCAVAISLFIVLLLRTVQGPIEFEVAGQKFRGASGPIIMWVLCFLSVVAALTLLWK